MITAYHLNVNELTLDFIEVLKKLYSGKSISITVEPKMDETEYLLSTEANKNALKKAIESNEGYEFSITEFQKLSSALLKGKKVNPQKLRKVKIRK